MEYANGVVKETRVEAVWPFEATTDLKLPLWGIRVTAGFPSPAEEFIESSTLDLNQAKVE